MMPMIKIDPIVVPKEDWDRMSDKEKHETFQACVKYANTLNENYESLAETFDKHVKKKTEKTLMEHYSIAIGIVIGGVSANLFIYIMNLLKEV